MPTKIKDETPKRPRGRPRKMQQPQTEQISAPPVETPKIEVEGKTHHQVSEEDAGEFKPQATLEVVNKPKDSEAKDLPLPPPASHGKLWGA